MRGLWVSQKGARRKHEYFANNWKREREFTMKEGDIFENLLDGKEYVVKDIVNKMVVLKSRKGEREILTEIETLKTKSFYQEKEKKVTNEIRRNDYFPK
jgi:hypothetical protein